jgi:large subunit ribosomal protein L22
MTGPKLNEGAMVAGERSGTKATAKYLRSSARKARVVLDLIRGLDVRSADEVLQFTERGIATEIRKVLASAVANAIHNDGHDADELYVIACFADEGPTLRRFRPRARGRATRIRKRTCHITVVVARMSDDRIEIVNGRRAGSAGGRPSSTAASRRARVERSRQRAAAAASAAAGTPADEAESDDSDVVDADIAEDTATDVEDTTDAAEVTEDATDVTDDAADAEPVIEDQTNETDEVESAEGSASDEAEPSAVESAADDKEGN